MVMTMVMIMMMMMFYLFFFCAGVFSSADFPLLVVFALVLFFDCGFALVIVLCWCFVFVFSFAGVVSLIFLLVPSLWCLCSGDFSLLFVVSYLLHLFGCYTYFAVALTWL